MNRLGQLWFASAAVVSEKLRNNIERQRLIHRARENSTTKIFIYPISSCGSSSFGVVVVVVLVVLVVVVVVVVVVVSCCKLSLGPSRSAIVDLFANLEVTAGNTRDAIPIPAGSGDP